MTESAAVVAPLLAVRSLSVDLHTPKGTVRALDDVDLTIGRGETLGLVGESGSGKTLTSLAIMGLLSRRRTTVTGSVELEGEELLAAAPRRLADLRGASMSMVFQEPRRSLNPAFSVGDQIAETLRRHRGVSRREAWARTVSMLDRVGIDSAERRANNYPHEFSGGMCQRVMLAMSMICEPKLLVADEPTTALDVTLQAQVLEMIRDLQAETGVAVLFISHDLGVIAEIAQRVIVMYAGQIVESGEQGDLFDRPLHPYGEGLLGSLPSIHADERRLKFIPGVVPHAFAWPTGCRFHPRCEYVVAGRCDTEVPAPVAIGDRLVRCVRAEELELDGIAP